MSTQLSCDLTLGHSADELAELRAFGNMMADILDDLTEDEMIASSFHIQGTEAYNNTILFSNH